MRYLANFLILTGIMLLFISSYFLWQRLNPNRLAFDNAGSSILVSSVFKEGSEPASLHIEDLDINLSVFPARVTRNRWETTAKGVSYLTSSAMPGGVGNSIFYGHNYKNLLWNLKNAKPGQEVLVKLKDDSWKKYRIEYVQVVDADQTGILDQTIDARLTLYTCTGFLDSKRLVVTAFLVES